MSSVRVVTGTSSGAAVARPADGLLLGIDQPITIGRLGDVPIGVEPEDTGISRRAVTVEAAEDGWRITATNANGVVICPWGQPSRWAELNREVGISWPLVGIRLIGTQPDLSHWVLLENTAFAIDRQAETHTSSNTSTRTSITSPPTPMTDPQQAAVQTVFGQHLSWPPTAAPAPMTLQAAASRLGVSHAAVYQRLEAARNRAYQFGSPQQIGVSDPEFIYVLVRAGYIDLPEMADQSTS